MRLAPLLAATGFASTLGFAAVASAQARPAAPAPCVTPTTPCERWITFGAGPARSMVYATHRLDAPNATLTRALIMVHGAGRNADHYFETATAAGFLAGALGNTLIVAPRFIAGQDKPSANEVMWPEGGNSWRAGGLSPTHPTISSFDFIDELVKTLANKQNFPKLTTIVVAGHSAGGQLATRYAMTSKVHDTPGVQISYVVANPSSYAWPSAVRPLPTGDANPVDADKEALGRDGEKVHGNFSYGPVRQHEGAELQQVAGRPGESRRLLGGHDARADDPAARGASHHLSPRSGGRAAAGRLRFLAERHGAGAHATRARRGVLQVRHRLARCEAPGADRVGVRTQRSLRLHDQCGVPGDLPEVAPFASDLFMHTLTAQRTMALPVSTLYRAWTTGWSTWFAEPDSVRVRAEAGAPFFFEVGQRFEDGRPMQRHPHYGRFLDLVPDALVRLTWVTGAGGTAGAESVVTVRFTATGDGTEVTVTQEGFATVEARDAHAAAWPMVLAQQEARLSARLHEMTPVDAAVGAGLDALRPNRSIPDASLIPVRSYPDLEAAVTWLRDALGCTERLRIAGHRVQLTVGNGAMVAAQWDPAAAPATGGRPPATLMVRVSNIDVTYQRALALGATAVTPPADQPFGERQAVLRDPAGHSWTLTQTMVDVDPARWGGELV